MKFNSNACKGAIQKIADDGNSIQFNSIQFNSILFNFIYIASITIQIVSRRFTETQSRRKKKLQGKNIHVNLTTEGKKIER